MRVKWAVELDGEVHMIELDHGDYSGRKTIKQNGTQVYDSGMSLIDRGIEHTIHVGSHAVVIKVVSSTFSFEYLCEVDGVSIDAHEDAEVSGAERSWEFDDAEGEHHTVTLEHGARNRKVMLDGAVVYDKGGFFSNFFLEEDKVTFSVGITPCEIIMREKDLGFEYFLNVGGRELKPTFERGKNSSDGQGTVDGHGLGGGGSSQVYGAQVVSSSAPGPDTHQWHSQGSELQQQPPPSQWAQQPQPVEQQWQQQKWQSQQQQVTSAPQQWQPAPVQSAQQWQAPQQAASGGPPPGPPPGSYSGPPPGPPPQFSAAPGHGPPPGPPPQLRAGAGSGPPPGPPPQLYAGAGSGPPPGPPPTGPPGLGPPPGQVGAAGLPPGPLPQAYTTGAQLGGPPRGPPPAAGSTGYWSGQPAAS